MTEVLVRNGTLEAYAQGTGVQLVAQGEAPLGPSVPQVLGQTLDAADASLDYVLADASLLNAAGSPELLATIGEWRRALVSEGRVVILTRHGDDIGLLEKLLGYEAGIFLSERIDQPDGETVHIFARQYAKSMRRHFASILTEVSWEGRVANWQDELRFDMASLLLQVGEGELAAQFYRRALAEEPDSIDSRVGLALSLALTSDWDEARSILTEVLEVDPDHGLAAAWLERAHAQSERASQDPSVLEPVARRPR